MKLIVAGGRDFDDYDTLKRYIDSLSEEFEIIEIVCGKATGADSLGEQWGIENDVLVKEFPADWRPNGVYDRAAGHKRNRKMGDYATHLIAFWDGKSRGTKGMIEYMESLNKPTFVVEY